MKIVDVAEFYAEQGGGVRTYIHQKLSAGAAAGHDIVIIAPGPEDGEEERLGGRIIWVKGPPLPPDPRYYVLYREKAVHDLLTREAPDVVEGSSPWSGGWFAARWPGRALKTFIFHQDPVAVYPQTLLGRWLGPPRVDALFGWYWAYLRRLSAHFDATIVSGEWLAHRLDTFGVKRPEAVPFGINKGDFSRQHRDPNIRKRLLEGCQVSPEAKLIVCVSRHHPEKRLGTVLEGFKRASREQAMGLVIYGDGPLRRWVERRAAGIPGVWVAGYTKDRQELAQVLASADAMLHGSAAETYGLVVAEALCSGLPVVVPDVGGAADLARTDCSERYRAGDAKDCARALLKVLDRDSEQLAQGCDRARARIGTMDDHFAELFVRYQALVEEHRGQQP